MKYKVVEKFVSINGEGTNAGKLAAFIRFAGCNLRCSFCDTMWANEAKVPYEEESVSQIVEFVRDNDVKFVTITGGEPLYREGICQLLQGLLELENVTIEIETNGSISLAEVDEFRKDYRVQNRVIFTMDYKLAGSGMESKMLVDNFSRLTRCDTVKFVVGSKDDLNRMKEIIQEYHLGGQCNLYISPVFGRIEPEEMVTYMIDNRLNEVTMQLQMHKFIWNPDKRGV